MPVEKATTRHGEVEYEVEECSNCNQEVKADEAITVLVDAREITCGGKMICEATHPSPRATRTLCPYCAEETLDYGERTTVGQSVYEAWGDLTCVGMTIIALIGAALGAMVAIEPVTLLVVGIGVGSALFLYTAMHLS